MEFAGGAVDPDLEILTISTNTYAVFQSKGKMPDAFIDTCHKVVTEFFSQSTQYEYAENVEFEVYFSANTADPNYTCEIRIAVNEKARSSRSRKNAQPSERLCVLFFNSKYHCIVGGESAQGILLCLNANKGHVRILCREKLPLYRRTIPKRPRSAHLIKKLALF